MQNGDRRISSDQKSGQRSGSSLPEPAKRFLNVGLLNDVTARECSMPHICESGPSHRFRHGRLLFEGGYCVEATGAQENRSAQKAGAWVEPPVPFPDAFATDAGVGWRPVV